MAVVAAGCTATSILLGQHLHLLDVARGEAALLRHLGVHVQIQHLAPPQELVERHLRGQAIQGQVMVRTRSYSQVSSCVQGLWAITTGLGARHELRHAAEQVVDHGQHLVAAGDLLGEHVEALEQVLVRLPAAQLRLDALEELQLLGQVAARQVRVLLCVVSAQISVRGVALL